MPLHWTYRDTRLEDDLEQGDILLPCDPLYELFRNVHPHFSDAKYNAFMVITQSCDLVRRKDGRCKTDYINLAVVRPLQHVLPMFLTPLCGSSTPGIFLNDKKKEAKQFLERIFNQNEAKTGLFYLHPDNEHAGIAQESVVLLRVVIAVHSHEHYDKLVNARKCGLTQDFQSKLGWLIGNIFSRVATRDWDKKEVNRMVDSNLPGTEFIWADPSAYETAVKEGMRFDGLTSTEIAARLEQCKPKPFEEALAAEASHEISKIINHLKSNMSAKEANLSVLNEQLEKIPNTIENRLKNNRLFKRAIDSTLLH